MVIEMRWYSATTFPKCTAGVATAHIIPIRPATPPIRVVIALSRSTRTFRFASCSMRSNTLDPL